MTPSPLMSLMASPAESRTRHRRERSCTDLSGLRSPAAFCSAVGSSRMRMLHDKVGNMIRDRQSVQAQSSASEDHCPTKHNCILKILKPKQHINLVETTSECPSAHQ